MWVQEQEQEQEPEPEPERKQEPEPEPEPEPTLAPFKPLNHPILFSETGLNGARTSSWRPWRAVACRGAVVPWCRGAVGP
jgi:hypothetical protein